MKKIYFVFCALLLAGCTKKAEVKPVVNALNDESVVVTYNFKGSVYGDYALYYVDPNSPTKTTVQFTGTEWTRNDTIKTGSYANGSNFVTAMCALIKPQGATYSMIISVNGEKKSNGSYLDNTLFAYQSYNYQIFHFKP